jgi:hypothetical protein
MGHAFDWHLPALLSIYNRISVHTWHGKARWNFPQVTSYALLQAMTLTT